MVQKALIILLFLIPSISYANVNLEFSQITIPEFAQTVLKGIIKRNYVMSPEVLTDARKITISIKDAKDEEIIPIVSALLAENGVTLVERSGFIYLTKKPEGQPLPQSSTQPQTTPEQGGYAVSEQPAQAELPESANLPIFAYRPRYREIKEIVDLLSFAGAVISQSPNNDVIFYKVDDEKQAIISDLLIELDQPANEVIVKAFIYEVSNNSRDVNALSLAVTMLNGKLGLGLTGTNAANSISLKIPNVDLIISAFNSDNRFKQVSSPSLRVRNGKNSRFSVGTETPTISSTTQSNNGNPIQSITYRSSGVILDITPRIFEDVTELDITQEISSFVPTTTGVNNSPTLIKREINTTITTTDGELIILGGLDEKRTSNQRTGLTFLPKWLHNKEQQDDKSDILLVLQVQRL